MKDIDPDVMDTSFSCNTANHDMLLGNIQKHPNLCGWETKIWLTLLTAFMTKGWPLFKAANSGKYHMEQEFIF